MKHNSLNNPEIQSKEELQGLQLQLKENPADWEKRKRVAQLQYNLGQHGQAADTIWGAPEIPAVDVEIGFSIRTLAKGKPRWALRLCHAVLDQNRGKPVKNLAIGNALLHHGMVMLAARFYGAAYAEEPGFADPEFEFWLLYVDDSQKLWGDWSDAEMKLEELPWMRRDEKLIEELSKTAAFKLTTPIELPTLPISSAESLEEISHVQHSKKEGVGPLAPPSIQFTPAAIASLGGDANVPGQRQAGDVAPASSAPLPSQPAAPAAPLPAQEQPETPAAEPAAPVSPPPAAMPAAANTVKLKLPGGQEVPSRKLEEGGPAAPKAPSITLPDIEMDES